MLQADGLVDDSSAVSCKVHGPWIKEAGDCTCQFCFGGCVKQAKHGAGYSKTSMIIDWAKADDLSYLLFQLISVIVATVSKCYSI